MGKIGIGERLNKNSKKNIIFGNEYRKVKLDPRTLIPSEHNTYSQENIEELADNMLLVGQLQEVIVGRVDGQNRIIVGHRRTAAAVLNVERGHDEFKLIDCKIREMSESMFMLTLHSANIFNRKLTDWELTTGIAEFTKYLNRAREAGEITIEGKMRDYIANVTGKSTGKINQINSINNNLCEEGKEAFEAGEMNFSTAYETSRLPEKQQKEVIEKKLLSKDVREMVQQRKQEEKKRAGDDYEPAHPQSINSLCYSCLHYMNCNVKTSTCNKCDQYANKAEAEKTDEQRYYEEQNEIDRKTREKLRQQEYEKKMETLPSERMIEIFAGKEYGEIKTGKQKFLITAGNKDMKPGRKAKVRGEDEKYCIVTISCVKSEHPGLKKGYYVLGLELE